MEQRGICGGLNLSFYVSLSYSLVPKDERIVWVFAYALNTENRATIDVQIRRGICS